MADLSRRMFLVGSAAAAGTLVVPDPIAKAIEPLIDPADLPIWTVEGAEPGIYHSSAWIKRSIEEGWVKVEKIINHQGGRLSLTQRDILGMKPPYEEGVLVWPQFEAEEAPVGAAYGVQLEYTPSPTKYIPTSSKPIYTDEGIKWTPGGDNNDPQA